MILWKYSNIAQPKPNAPIVRLAMPPSTWSRRIIAASGSNTRYSPGASRLRIRNHNEFSFSHRMNASHSPKRSSKLRRTAELPPIRFWIRSLRTSVRGKQRCHISGE
jgi:hypothetical protein